MTFRWAVCLLAVLILVAPLSAGELVDFTRHVKPILTARCAMCHDANGQQSGLRLDAGVLVRQGGNHGPSVAPGKSGESLLVKVLLGKGELPRMPLDDDPLPPAQIALIKRWIDEGAKIPADEKFAPSVVAGGDHWSFQPIGEYLPPPVRRTGWAKHPLDRFILARLEEEGMSPSSEADRVTLVRRLSLDLLGLPPSIEEVDRFLHDTRPGAYERLVERLLASPRYGERWGRHWLDVARYADSNGYTIDGARSIWKFRDWVIDAVNADVPFDRFTIEQLAGDMLPSATREQIVATGFHRNTLINQEGGTDREQFRVEAVVDRVSTTGAAWLGLTVGCARCHSHKYDPVSQREFYQLFALFNNCDEPNIPVPSAEQSQRQREASARLKIAEAKLREYDAGIEQRRREWEKRLAALPMEVKWYPLRPSDFKSAGGAKLTRLDDDSLLAGGKIPASDTYTVTFEVPLRGVTSLRLQALTHDSLPKQGPGLAGNGNFVLTDFKIQRRTLEEPDVYHPVKLVSATADHSQARFDVAAALDDDPDKSGWAINVGKGSLNVDRHATFVFEKALAPNDIRLTLTLRHGHPNRYNLGRFRVLVTAAPPEVLALPTDIRAALAIPPEKRTAEQQQALMVELRRNDPGRAPLQAEVNRVRKQLEVIKKTIPTTMVMRERSQPRQTHIHIRGDFLRKGAKVTGDVPAVLPRFGKNLANPTRLDFARWLVDPANPLTARVTVNRLWQRYFGRGLVETENDFGTQGARPTHPRLLDYLAAELVRREWSLKAMHQLIVTSATYRQSSHVSAGLLNRDPFNKLLARQSRLRVQAETLRDVALSTAGLLSAKLSGPGVFPPQPDGIYRFTQNQKNWRVSPGEDRYRRGMYTYFWRSSPDPFLTTFDAPGGNATCTRRIRSNTPLQALTLANDAAFVEMAKSLAQRVLRESPSASTDQRIRHAFRLCLARQPSEWEAGRLLAFYEKQLRKYQAVQEAQDTSPEQAAWTATARVLLNLDEFMTRE